jgi:hypothetical protein
MKFPREMVGVVEEYRTKICGKENMDDRKRFKK